MERKSFKLELDEKGTGSAIIATLDVVDLDGDLTEPGAFGKQSVRVIPSHDWRHVPIGKGVVSEDGDKTIADFKLNLEIPAARDWYEAFKFDLANGEPMQEWSYGFDILEAGEREIDGQKVRILKKLKVHEISPVLLGAGVGTGTLDIKEDKQGFEVQTLIFPKMHWTVDTAIDWAHDHALRASRSGAEETEESFRFRQVDPDEFLRLRTICINPGRDTPPDSDECKVKAVGGPKRESSGLRFAEQLEKLCDDVYAALARADEIKALRVKNGQSQFSDERRRQLREVSQALKEADERLTAFLAEPPDEQWSLIAEIEYALMNADAVLRA